MRSRSLDKTNPARVCAGLINLGSRQNSSQPGAINWHSLVFVKAIVIALGKRKRKLGNGRRASPGAAGTAGSAEGSDMNYVSSQVQHKWKSGRSDITTHESWMILWNRKIPDFAYLQSSKNLRCLIWQAAQVPCLLLCHSVRRKNLCEIRRASLS